MSHYICRYRRDDDPPRYFIWSTVVDSPISGLMSRDKLRKKLVWENGHKILGSPGEDPDERMDRADEYGSSCRWTNDLFWDDDIFTQAGMAKRDSLHIKGHRFWYDPAPEPFKDTEAIDGQTNTVIG